MAYLEAYVVWEGALDEERLFAYGTTGEVEYKDEDTGSVEALDTWVSRIIEKAKKEKASVQIYTLDHEHGMEETDCECVQYLTDHSPYAEYSPDAE